MPELHIRECGVVFHFSDQDWLLELFYKRDVNQNPNWIFFRAFRLEIVALLIELRRVGVGLARHARDAVHTVLFAARMKEQTKITDPHLIAHKIPRLIIAHAGPRGLFVFLQLPDRVAVTFSFEEPVVHDFVERAR